MNGNVFFKSVIDADTAPVVICDTEHRIVYLNPVACKRYERFGGADLLGKNLLDCHNPSSKERIADVLSWFCADPRNNRVRTFYNKEENKDVYMIALRDADGRLIGYYEKHEFRDCDPTPLYAMETCREGSAVERSKRDFEK